MNSYNENLRSTCGTVLQGIELEIKKLSSEFNAAMFTLYYAQGARMTAEQKLLSDKVQLNEKELLKDLSVNVGSVSTNALFSSDQDTIYTKRSVAEAAVCAANVQIAANAITRLASDAASIFSIVNAVDLGSEIYELSQEVKKTTEMTAYNVENASDLAMEASALTAAISSDGVNSIASETDRSIKEFIKDMSDAYEDVSENVVLSNTKLTESRNSEKLAEARWELAQAAYESAVESYRLANNDLNLGLSVAVKDFNTYEVSFKPLESPFNSGQGESPVSGYYLVLVKEEKKYIFSPSNAQQLLEDESSKRLFKVSQASRDLNPSEEKKSKVKRNDMISCTIKSSELLDSDGDKIVAGKSYVIFVLAIIKDSLKKHLNDSSDFLSLPSFAFSLTRNLECPSAEDFIFNETSEVNSEENDPHGPLNKAAFSFCVTESEINQAAEVQFRCMFLPFRKNMNDSEIPNHGSLNVFNRQIAQIVTAANYSIAQVYIPESITEEDEKDGKQYYKVEIDSSTTDNYGNPLVSGNQYIPVVLAISRLPESQLTEFTSAITNFMDTPPFTYSGSNNPNKTV